MEKKIKRDKTGRFAKAAEKPDNDAKGILDKELGELSKIDVLNLVISLISKVDTFDRSDVLKSAAAFFGLGRWDI